MNNRKPLIIAHRGASGEAPENTLAAFQLALEQGCDALELDIHLSLDGRLMVCHDFTVDRTTNASGRIVDIAASQLRTYDAGIWFNKKYKGQQIPFLAEVFEMIPQDIIVNVEIKMIPEYENKIEQKLVDLLIEKDRLSNVVISSFDHSCLVRLMKMEPRAKIGLLYQSSLINPVEYAALLNVPVFSLHPHFKSINKNDIIKAKSYGISVYPWTVDQIKDMRKLINKGAAGIITNYPVRMKALKLN
jgi:glycerophosphoryl diester phosphodiesterase